MNRMHGPTGGVDANPRPLAGDFAGHYDDAGVVGNSHIFLRTRLPDRHVGATETMFTRCFFSFFTVVTVAATFLAPAVASAEGSKLPLILKEDFEHGFSRWQTT